VKASERRAAKERFLESLQADPNVSLACDVALISRDTAYRWRDGDRVFAKAWDEAVERTRNVARSSIYQRGILGWDEPMVSMGQLVYTWEPVLDDQGKQMFDQKGKPVVQRGALMMAHKWSDSLTALYAKANLPEYKDKPQVNIHAQLADLAETAKQELLADLAQAVADESQEPSDTN
jgi:hypothetical protein